MSDPNKPESDGLEKGPRLIKRYSNRKMYDTKGCDYVNYPQIVAIVKTGEDVKIVDTTTQEDITASTLEHILFETEKGEHKLPLAVLQEMVRHPGESITDFITKEITPRIQAIRKKADSKISGFLDRSDVNE
jgi:polyhydroxyalkanoate synthesis repressor PhaR